MCYMEPLIRCSNLATPSNTMQSVNWYDDFYHIGPITLHGTWWCNILASWSSTHCFFLIHFCRFSCLTKLKGYNFQDMLCVITFDCVGLLCAHSRLLNLLAVFVRDGLSLLLWIQLSFADELPGLWLVWHLCFVHVLFKHPYIILHHRLLT